jgi:hypothetical protein
MKVYQNLTMIITVSLLITVLLSSTILPYVFAANPSSGFKSSVNCSWSKATYNLKTCCWRESNGSSLGESYCQSCTMGGSGLGTIVTCGQPELQFRSGSHWGIGVISPSGGNGVLAQSNDIELQEGEGEAQQSNEATEEVAGEPSQETVTNIPFGGGKISKQTR